MASLPPPDISAAYVDDKNRPSKDFFNWIKSLYQIVIGNLAAWTAYTPTITAETGTITTKSAVARFKQIGKTVFLQVDITITNAGAATGGLIITLPVADHAPPAFFLFGGSETTGTAFGFPGGASNLIILNSDGSSPIVTGNVLTISGSYEAA